MSQKNVHEDAAAYLHSITGNTVIVTLGEKGAFTAEKDGTSYLIPEPSSAAQQRPPCGIPLHMPTRYPGLWSLSRALPFRRSSFRRSPVPKSAR